CLEALASAAALERRCREQTGRDLRAEQIVAAAESDPAAARLWEETIDCLAEGLMTAVAMLDPDTIVLGGGLAEAGDALLRPLGAAMRSRATFHVLPHLVRAELGDESGCIGAALLGLDRLRAHSVDPNTL
ncbi:MAG: ROK family protein, partial [Stackebrandtia sp.]